MPHKMRRKKQNNKMSKEKCPYCGEEIEVDIENPEDEMLTQIECSNCGKVVNVKVSIIINYDLSECKCQGENHEWELTTAHPRCATEWYCVHCGETKPLTDDDRKKYGIPTRAEYFKSLTAV